MPEKPGHFIWYDVMTTDTAAATAFYKSVLCWGAMDAGMPDQPYTLLTVGNMPVAGLMAIPEDACKEGVGPAWMGYIGVDDVDRYVERVKKAGGAIYKGPQDIPGVGRFAVAGDPHGGGFILFDRDDGRPREPVPPGTPGYVGWHELYAGDREGDLAFYSGLFGWQKAEAFDTPMGVYQTFGAGERAFGGAMSKPAQVPRPGWLFYFNVADIDAAISRVKDAGGTVMMGPVPVPGGGRIAQCRDPQGAVFAMIACPQATA